MSARRPASRSGADPAAGFRAGAVPPVIALSGDDDRAKERLFAELLERLGEDAAVTRWNPDVAVAGGETSRLLADLAARPLFGGRKLIVARDGDALLKKAGPGLAAALELSSGNHLVLFLRSLDGRTSFAQRLKKSGGLFTCTRPRADAVSSGRAGQDVLRAVDDEARRAGVRLGPGVAAELLGRVGNDLLLLGGELDKLALYLGGPAAGGQARTVSLADVDAAVPQSAAWEQFRLFEEVANGRTAVALSRLGAMLRHGTLDRAGRRTTDPRAIAMGVAALLQRRLRLLCRLVELEARGVSGEELRRALKIRNPGQMYFLAKETGLPLVRAGAAATAHFLAADRGLKSSEPPDLVLERLVIGLCGLARGGIRPAAPGRSAP